MNQQVMVSQPQRHYCSCGAKIHYQSKLCPKCNAKRSGLKRLKRILKKAVLQEKYAVLKVDSCPRCGAKGSLHLKAIKNKVHKTYHYYYCAHYSSEKDSEIRWCYVRKDVAVEMLIQAQSLPNTEGQP